MNDRRHSGTVLFLTELILDILFFAIAASVCLQLYAGAAGRTRQSDRKSEAINAAENVIALLRAGKGTFSVLDESFPVGETNEEHGRVLEFDQDGNYCPGEGEWSMKVNVAPGDEGISLVDIEAVQGDEVFYHFSHELALEAFYEE